MNDWNIWLARWAEAGLIDADAAARIRAFEDGHASSGRLRWPVMVAIAFGALMLGGGVLLFVAAHWDALSPAVRFTLVVAMVGGFHVAAALIGDRVPGLSTALHAVGTMALGAGIALAGQIFHLDEHWPSGILMWAVGATAAWFVLRHTAQAVIVAILVPAWLLGEWAVATRNMSDLPSTRVAACGLFLLALTYFTMPRGSQNSGWQRAAMWVGGVALLPAAAILAGAASRAWWHENSVLLSLPVLHATGWAVSLGLPLALAFVTRGREALPHAAAAAWALVHLSLGPLFDTVALYPWWVIGSVGLVAWGIRDGRSERVNMGAAIFAATVLTFYFSQVMDKLGRAASLIGMGLLFLAGGWALERVRRRLVHRARETA